MINFGGGDNVSAITFAGHSISTVYWGNTIVWPNVTYFIYNAVLNYSSGSMIAANASNYAYISATVRGYRGTILVYWEDNVVLEPHEISDPNFAFHTSGNTIVGYNRTNVTGSSYSAVYSGSFRGVYTSGFTVTQSANTASTKEETTSYTNLIIVPTQNPFTANGGTVSIAGLRTYKYWTEYSSGYRTPSATTSAMVSAETVSNGSATWISVSADNKNLIIAANTGTTNRTATVYGSYGGVTGSCSIEQYRSAYSTEEHQIVDAGLDPATIPATWQTSNQYSVVYMRAQSRTKTWRDGVETYTPWEDFTGYSATVAYAIIDGGATSNFQLETTGYTSQGSMAPFSFARSYDYGNKDGSYYGRVFAYPTSENTGDARSVDIVAAFYSESRELTLTQAAVVPAITCPSAMTISSGATTSYLAVTSNVTGWTVSESATWLSTTATTDMVILGTSANTGTTSRSTTISIKYKGTTYATCQLTQEEFVVSISCASSLTISSAATTTYLTVTSNVTGWTVGESATWLTCTVSGNSQVQVVATANGGAQRSATLNIRYKGVTYATCEIIQQAVVVSITCPATLFIDATATTTYLPVTSNVTGWTVSENASWMTGSTYSSTQARIRTSQNTSSSSRSATLNILYGGTTYASCYITQQAVATAVTITCDATMSVGSGATTSYLTVVSNVTGWTVSESASWMTASTYNSSAVTITTAANAGESRNAVVSINYNGTTYATCTVTQASGVNPYGNIDIRGYYGDWVIGVVKRGFDTNSIVVANSTSINASYTAFAEELTYSSGNTSDTTTIMLNENIPSGSTFTDYYGVSYYGKIIMTYQNLNIVMVSGFEVT